MNNLAPAYDLNSLGMRVDLPLPYEQARERVIAALKEQGFGILSEIDVKATLKQKLDADFRKYAILGACNPPLANRAFNTDLNVGLLLPCNVIVYEEGTGSVVSIVNPIAMLGITDSPSLAAVAQEAHTRLSKVVEALAAG